MGVGPQLQENARPLDDATVVSGKTAPADDATIILGQRPGARAEADMKTSALEKKSTSPGADDSTSARRNSGAKSGARSTGAGGGGFLGRIVVGNRKPTAGGPPCGRGIGYAGLYSRVNAHDCSPEPAESPRFPYKYWVVVVNRS